MNEEKLKILLQAVQILHNAINQDLFVWLVDNTSAKPDSTRYQLMTVVEGLQQAQLEGIWK